jgi:signal transduction histidine kinase
VARLLAADPYTVFDAEREPELFWPGAVEFLRAHGCRYALAFPIRLGGRLLGQLSVAYAAPPRLSAEQTTLVRALSTQAALAIEVTRLGDKAREAAVAREREQAADARAAVLRATNTALAKRLHLVEAAVESADALLAAAAVADAMPAVLARVGGVLGADRALLMRFEPPDAATQLGWAILDHEWTAPGVPRQGDDPALARLKLDHYADVVHRLHAERFVEIHTSDLPDAGRAEQEATGARSQVVLSVLVRGQVWGFLGFDDCHAERAWDEAEIGLMQIVTASLGGAIERETLAAERAAAERAVLAEREQAAEARAVELARVNAALREPVAALARGEGVGGLLSSILSEAARQAGADHAAVFLHDADADALRLVGACVDGGAVAQPGEAPWLVPFAAPVPVAEAPSWSVLGAAAEPWLVHPVADTVLTWPGTRAMHETAGHATLGYVRLQVGGRPLGFVGLAWRAASPALTPDQRGVVTALAQQLALALELDRLAATAAAEQRQAAVLEERTRLAREIHDTLAQGLAGIVMQLRAARATLGPLEGASTPALDRVERLARENLVEARRSLAMLRPAALDRGGLDVALRDLVSAARDTSEVGTRARGGGPGEIRYEVLGTPIPLPADVEMELLRIAQAALTNAVQHAAASAVHVELAYERRRAAAGASDGREALATDGVRLAVTDDGRGFDGDDVPSGRFGLLGMSERAVRVGAVLTVVTAPGEGTQVVVMWRATPGGTA